jgi:hypothetical protein
VRTRLKRIVADQALNIDALKEIAKRNWQTRFRVGLTDVSPTARGSGRTVAWLRSRPSMAARRQTDQAGLG